MTARSNLSKMGAAFLLIWLGVGCGSPDSASPALAVNTADDGSTPDTGTAEGGSTAAANPSDSNASGWNMSGANTSDSSAPDSNAEDGSSLADSGSPYDANTEDLDGGASALAVNLGTAGNYAVLAKSGISSVPTCAITGDLGVSPAAATSITGFSLIADPTNVFSTSRQVTGKVYGANYTSPTPSNLTTAIGDMQLAFTDAAGRTPEVTELGAGNIGGMTLPPGVYKWGTSLLIPTDVTLTGSGADVWIFQIAQDLTMSNAARIVLTGGAAPKNVFWQVSGLANLGTTAHFEGVILTQTSIALGTGASINGRLLAQTAVTLEGNSVVEPAL
jgi:Ice-binding-like